MSRCHSEVKPCKGGSSIPGPFEFNTEGHGLPIEFRLTNFGPRQDRINVPDDMVYAFLFSSVIKEEIEDNVVNPQIELETGDSMHAKDFGMNVTISPIPNSDNMVTVHAIDVLYPIIDDPYTMGKIACAEVLSNLYAIGITECNGIRITLGLPDHFTDKEKDIVLPYIINGFKDVAREARTETTMGNYMSNLWLTIGGTASSISSLKACSTSHNCCVNDVLVLTKPLGTQVAINSFQWLEKRSTKWDVIKSNVSGEEIRKAYHIAIDSMSRLNRTAAMLLEKYDVRGVNNVGRDGLVPSVQRLLNRQENEISFIVLNVPVIGKMQIIDRATGYTFKLIKGHCPETSGGLLVCMTREEAVEYCRDLETVEGYKAWVIGVAVKGERAVRMSEQPMVIQVTSNMSNVNYIG